MPRLLVDLLKFRSSTYAEDVDNALQSLGYLLVREDTFSGLAVDFMLYLEGGNVEVEVYGPSHLNRTTLGPNGRTRLKQRMLRSMGYKLLCVPYHHWDLLRSPQAQTAYLEERLVGVMSGTDDGTTLVRACLARNLLLGREGRWQAQEVDAHCPLLWQMPENVLASKAAVASLEMAGSTLTSKNKDENSL